MGTSPWLFLNILYIPQFNQSSDKRCYVDITEIYYSCDTSLKPETLICNDRYVYSYRYIAIVIFVSLLS